MRAIGMFILLLLLIAAVFFSMANREIAHIGVWPLDMRLDMPVFLPILGCLAAGFVAGWIGGWRNAGATRRQLRQALRAHRDAAVEVDRLKGELKRLQNTSAVTAGRDPQIAA